MVVLPKLIPREAFEEERAVQQAVDPLPYGRLNINAAEVEAKARADFRRKQRPKHS